MSKDSQIQLQSDVESKVKNTMILSEKGMINTTQNEKVEASNKHFKSLKKSFESPHEINMFRYYLSDYLNSRINLQYFLFLISNRLSKSSNKIFKNERFRDYIKLTDKPILEKFLNKLNKSEQASNKDEIELRNEQICLEYFKNSLVVN